MSIDAEWVQRVVQEWNTNPVPERCERSGCRRDVETWCPLCCAFFCAEHDELVPVRRHDCLRGKAEA